MKMPEKLPIKIVGGNQYGIYPKISVEKTYNMFVSDGWLVNYIGHQRRTEYLTNNGRGIFSSVYGKFMLIVIGGGVYKVDSALNLLNVGAVDSSEGDVYIDENLSGQICIVDGIDAYIYDYADTNTVTRQNLPFNPSYVVYHNTYFLFGSSLNSAEPYQWHAYQINGVDTTSIALVTTLTLQSKPDAALAVVRIPGSGNNVLVLGRNCGEVWVHVGGTENYRKVSSFNMDNGVVNVATIGYSDSSIFWLGRNEKGTLTVFESNGQNSAPISNDGLNRFLENVNYPEYSTAFCHKVDGHLIYHLTFYHQDDNKTIFYDANSQLFFFASDANLDYYPARRVVSYNNKTYSISLNDSAIYEIGDEFLTYNDNLDPDVSGYVIPRLRYTNAIRSADGEPFRMRKLSFIMEQGVTNYQPGDTEVPRIDIAMTKNGGQSFGTFVNKDLNPSGHYKNTIEQYNLGYANEVAFLFRFLGKQRFVVGNAVLELY
ncbi:hypothetical protein YTPLAS21_19110 [Candidatus Nitrosocosmicus sp.]|nr:hypothetical protein YTPLAS21_19110 [Candidatus Nitrosocosmicus sp.]